MRCLDGRGEVEPNTPKETNTKVCIQNRFQQWHIWECVWVKFCLLFVNSFLSGWNRHYSSLPLAVREARTPSALLWSGVNMTAGGHWGVWRRGGLGLRNFGWGISSPGQTQPPTLSCYRLPLRGAFVSVTKTNFVHSSFLLELKSFIWLWGDKLDLSTSLIL